MHFPVDIIRELVDGGRVDRDGKNIIGAKCPYCNHNEFGISLGEDHLWGCFRKKKCGETGNIYKLLTLLKRFDLLRGGVFIENIDKIEVLKEFDEEEIDIEIQTIKPPIGFKRVQSHPYLDERGFTFYNKMPVGVTKFDRDLIDYVIFLIEDNYQTKGYVARSLMDKKDIDENNRLYKETRKGKFIPRYVNSTKTDFTKLLGGYDEIVEGFTKTVILVEGIFGKSNIDRIYDLDNQLEIKCCITFGAKISIEQIYKLKLKGVKNIIILFDNDVVNIVKDNACDACKYFEDVKIGFIEIEDKDPADLDVEELNDVFDNLYNPIEFYLSKLKIYDLN